MDSLANLRGLKFGVMCVSLCACLKEIKQLPRRRNIAAPLFRVAKKLKGNQTGVSLIETVIALAVLGIIAVAFLGGLATAAKATFIADERATAESLARSQIEGVKGQVYISYDDPEHGEYAVIAPPADSNFSIESITIPIYADTGQPLPSGEDNDIQKIKVTVKRGDKTVFIVEDYKVDR